MTQQPRTPTTEPTTEAGRRMLRWLIYAERTGDPLPPNHETAILAIEAEARADLLAQIEKAVPRCRGDEVCDLHAELLFDGRCEDYDRGVRDALDAAIRSAAPVEPAGESKTVFRFDDGSVGPGKWDPTGGGRVVPDTEAPK